MDNTWHDISLDRYSRCKNNLERAFVTPPFLNHLTLAFAFYSLVFFIACLLDFAMKLEIRLEIELIQQLTE